MPQTQMNDDFDIARAGMLYDNNDTSNDVVSCIVDPGVTGFQGGCPLFEVTAGAEDAAGHRAIVSPSGSGKFVGFALFAGMKQPQGHGPSTVAGGAKLWGPRDVVPVLRRGRIWLELFGAAVAKGTSLSAGTSGDLGKVTGGAGTNIPCFAYMKSVSSNTLVVGELSLPVPNTADAAAQDADGT